MITKGHEEILGVTNVFIILIMRMVSYIYVKTYCILQICVVYYINYTPP